MDNERYIEHILETENLTDALDDDDASWLLDWGIGRLDEALGGATDQKTADHRASALMAMMRKMNTIAGSYRDKDSQSLAQELGDYQGLVAEAFPLSTNPLARSNFADAAVHISHLSSREVLEFLAGDFFR